MMNPFMYHTYTQDTFIEPVQCIIVLTVDIAFLFLLPHVILLMVLSKLANGKILVESEEPRINGMCRKRIVVS